MEALREVYPFDKSKYVTCIIWDVEVRQCPKEWFLEYTTLPFEGIQVKVPKDYDSVLRDTYGDYMQLPPERERHRTMDIDFIEKKIKHYTGWF